MALRVLSQENPALLQLHHKTQGKVVRKVNVMAHVNVNVHGCPLCHKASLFLRQQEAHLHSELIATAAMTTGSGEALQPVVQQLQELVTRIDDQQRAEEEHKEWCEHELAETAKTKAHHEQLVEELKQKIEDTQGEIADKQQGIKDTAEAIQTADKEFNELKDERAKAKAEFDAEHADYVDAIQALNQAIDILGDFYRDQQEFVQVAASTRQMPPADLAAAGREASAPTMGNYVRKGGGHVVTILKDTRVDFEAGKKSLEEQEEPQLALSQQQSDLESNEGKVQSAISYLAQVGGSCNMLIENFAERTRLRQEESKAIQDAIGILQQAAYS